MARWSVSQPRELELEVIALRHQLVVLRRQRPGRTRLSPLDRLLWIWLYRVWPRCLNIVVLVKPAAVVQWHRQERIAFEPRTATILHYSLPVASQNLVHQKSNRLIRA